MKFCEKLRSLRNENNMTQSQLADIAGVSLRTVISYEKGESYPKKRSTYDALAKALGTQPDYLRNENEDFVEAAAEKYGTRGKMQARQLVSQLGGMFAGGELSDDDKEAVFMALQKAYWDAKLENKKYTSKNKQE